MITVKGTTWRVVSANPCVTETVEIDLYMLGIFNENGNITEYVRLGRPSTY